MLSRPAKLTECNRCRTPILTGHDDCGLDVRATAVCLTRHGEIQAMAAGRDCWRLDHERRLWATDRWRILSDIPLPGDHRITAHVCGQPIPADWAAPTPAAVTLTPREGELMW